MARKPKKNRKRFLDVYAIYYSKQDKCWIAHSLRTDQFGTGACVVDAFVDGMKAVDQVIDLAKKHSDIQVLRDAPEEIQKIAKNAMRLPDEIFEIAHKKLYGEWPKELPFDLNPEPSVSFTRKILEEVGA